MISKLIDKIVNTGAPIVVGLDPKLDFVPEDIKKRCFEEKGENLEGVAEAFWQFNKEIIDIFRPFVFKIAFSYFMLCFIKIPISSLMILIQAFLISFI